MVGLAVVGKRKQVVAPIGGDGVGVAVGLLLQLAALGGFDHGDVAGGDRRRRGPGELPGARRSGSWLIFQGLESRLHFGGFVAQLDQSRFQRGAVGLIGGCLGSAGGEQGQGSKGSGAKRQAHGEGPGAGLDLCSTMPARQVNHRAAWRLPCRERGRRIDGQ